MSNVPSHFVVTKEYLCFAEFCDACRDYGYIGLCYRAPGVGKTLSARYYANWDQVGAYSPYRSVSEAELAALQGSDTIFYTPKVANTPSQIEQEIKARVVEINALHTITSEVVEVARESLVIGTA